MQKIAQTIEFPQNAQVELLTADTSFCPLDGDAGYSLAISVAAVHFSYAIIYRALASSRRDAAFLVRFLPSTCKFDCERSYALLESYYRVRAQHAEVFHQLTPSSVEHVWNDDAAQVMPKPDKFDRQIAV